MEIKLNQVKSRIVRMQHFNHSLQWVFFPRFVNILRSHMYRLVNFFWFNITMFFRIWTIVICKLHSRLFIETIRGDLIQVYRIINSLDNLNVDDFFKLQTSSRTRGHGNKIIKLRFNTSVRQHYFSQRVINDWNNLPTSAVLAKSITVFKKEIDNHLHECIYDF